MSTNRWVEAGFAVATKDPSPPVPDQLVYTNTETDPEGVRDAYVELLDYVNEKLMQERNELDRSIMGGKSPMP